MRGPLLVHPKPAQDESLTSFVMRTAVANEISVVDFWAEFNSKFNKAHLKDVHQLDLDPYRVCDVTKLCEFTLLDENYVSQMSFRPLFEKFLDPEDLEIDKTRTDFVQRMLETQHRRYCPLCIAEAPAFQLLWQVKEIHVCQRHKTELLDNCRHCGKKLNLVHPSLTQAQCQHCGEDLAEHEASVLEAPQSQSHSQLEADWRGLLSPDGFTVPSVVNSRRKSLAISLLYVAQGGGEQVETTKVQGMTNEYANRLLRFIRDQNRPKRPTLSFLLGVLRDRNITLTDFAQTNPNLNFVKSTLQIEESEDITAGVCLAPWCDSYGKRDKMHSLNLLTRKVIVMGYSDTEFTNVHMCRDCNLRYGNAVKGGEWGEVDGLIHTGYQEILARLNKGTSRRQISLQLDVTDYTVTKMAAYFARRGLLLSSLRDEFELEYELEMEPEEYFRRLQNKGTKTAQASTMYGWNQKQYLYMYYHPEVQHYLFIEAERQRGPVKEPDEKRAAYWEDKFLQEVQRDVSQGIPLSLESIAARIGCSKETITRYKLSRILTDERFKQDLEQRDYYWKQTKQFIDERFAQNERILVKDYFRHIGKSEKWMKKRFPDMVRWVKEQIPIASQRHKEAVLHHRIVKAQGIVRKLQSQGRPYRFKDVAEEMGLSPNLITYYRALHDAILETAVSVDKESD